MSSKKYTVVISYKNSRNGIIKEMIDTFLQIVELYMFYLILREVKNKANKFAPIIKLVL